MVMAFGPPAVSDIRVSETLALRGLVQHTRLSSFVYRPGDRLCLSRCSRGCSSPELTMSRCEKELSFSPCACRARSPARFRNRGVLQYTSRSLDHSMHPL